MIYTIHSNEHKKSIVTCYIRVKTHKNSLWLHSGTLKQPVKFQNNLSQRFRFLSNKTKNMKLSFLFLIHYSLHCRKS